MTNISKENQIEEVENIYIMMFSLQTLQNYGISIKKTIENSLVHLWRWYQQSGEEKYLSLAGQHMQAYVNMGFALDEKNQTICDILNATHQMIEDFFPKGYLPGKRVKLTKTQVRSMIGRWKPSKTNPMTIGELVEDIIQKVRNHQTGRYIYRYCRRDRTSKEEVEIYELVINEHHFTSF